MTILAYRTWLPLAAILILCLSCKPTATDIDLGITSTTVSVAQAQELIASTADLVILDVRTPSETAEGTLPGAQIMNINGSDFETQIQSLDKNTPVLVYCKSGSRSAKACKALQKAGIKTTYDMTEGYHAYKTATN